MPSLLPFLKQNIIQYNAALDTGVYSLKAHHIEEVQEVAKSVRNKRDKAIEPVVTITKKLIIERIKKHKLRFDIDYERGIYDISPREADIYVDSIDDILRIIRKMK